MYHVDSRDPHLQLQGQMRILDATHVHACRRGQGRGGANGSGDAARHGLIPAARQPGRQLGGEQAKRFGP